MDFRSDRDDYRRRCRKVHKALYTLGVPREAWLVTETPSGGRHYRFFFTQHVRTDDIPGVLENVGLKEASGQIEVFPKRNKGLRLPFGCIPGRQHEPEKWLKFIRAWQAGEVPRVNWLRCMDRADSHAQRMLEVGLGLNADNDTAPSRRASTRANHSRQGGNRKPHTLGMPRRRRLEVPKSNLSRSNRKQYVGLLSRPFAGPADAEQLWQLGIQLEGTRVEATKRLAWHLTHVRGLAVEAAGDQLCRWVYETGRKTSKDVQADICSGTRKVEKQTRELVEWCATHTDNTLPRGVFSSQEVESILRHVDESDADRSKEQVDFALHFLRFAKQNGEHHPDGWECKIAVRGIIRRWPGCSGMRYKTKMEWIVQSGLVEMTREKRQTSNGTGRPRTYLIRAPKPSAAEQTLGFSAAAQYARERISAIQGDRTSTGSEIPESDTYGRFVPPLPQRSKGKVYEVVGQEDKAYEGSGSTELKPTAAVPSGTNLASSPNAGATKPGLSDSSSNGGFTSTRGILPASPCTAEAAGLSFHCSQPPPSRSSRRKCRPATNRRATGTSSSGDFRQQEAARLGINLKNDCDLSDDPDTARQPRPVNNLVLGREPP